jgi:hypothetical protein
VKNEIASMADLAEKIKELEALEKRQMAGIKVQMQEISEDLKPAVLVKNAFNEIAGNTNLKHTIIDTSLGIGAGFLARKLFTSNSKNIFRKMTGYALQLIATNIVTKKMPVMREKITDL